MLTDCFRVSDSTRSKWLLAEPGIDISQLDRASQELRRVQEAALIRDSVSKRLLAQVGQRHRRGGRRPR